MFLYIAITVFLFSYTFAETYQRGLWEVINDLLTNPNIYHDISEDAQYNISQLVNKYGYHFEEHTVVTDDGYSINIHRVRKKNRTQTTGPVVFLMHGIMESSDSWVLLGQRSLAYLLADKEYDVWLGNSRGNKHALKHISMTHKEPDFWNFTWDEIGLYDLPAMIDYILYETGVPSIYYIGHSQGTTVFYVMCSMKPEYNTAIKIMFSLAPVAWMGNVKSALVRAFSPARNLIGYLLSDINMYISGTDLFNKIASFTCYLVPSTCKNNILYSISGPSDKITESMMTVMFAHMPTGSSTLQFIHYGQLVLSKQFCRFDHGSSQNIIMYGGSVVPPAYDMSKIVVPVVIFYSRNDLLSDPNDVETLVMHLHNKEDVIYLEDFSHLDYVYANEASDMIYYKIIEKINKIESYDS